MKGLNYYEQAYPLYQGWRDEARAAQVQANRGALLIEHGNLAQGVLDVKNALRVFENLGDRRFQTFALRVLATYYRRQGQLKDASRELNKGLAIARERNLADSVTVMTTMLALTQFDDGDYEEARRSLLDALKGATGRRSTEARIHLARTYVRLGDLAAAESDLRMAEQELNASPNDALAALLWLVRGEWSIEGNHTRDGRSSFEKASMLWQGSFPEPAAVEARAHLGFLDAVEGRIDGGHQMLRSSIEGADKLAHRSLRVRCYLLLADAEIARGQLRAAAEALGAIPPDDATATIGPELRAQVYDVSGRLQQALGDPIAAAKSADAARAAIGSIAKRIPVDRRAAFEARPLVQRIGR
jgi:ATP/maltotriose-dependent transcriptional regulator MalT